MHIRQGNVRDWPFLFALGKEVIPASISPWRKQSMEDTLKYREKILKGFWTWIQQTESKVFIAENNNREPVGYLVLYPSSREELTGMFQGWVMDLAVLQEYRKQGIGRLLMKAAEEYCRENKINYLGLAVSSHNIQALHLYQELGFIEERKLMVKVLE
jgi:ribosomal protein S18 acetylase RimI-like enzyme